ncbi:MAG: fold protein [Evtepia sp.]
MIGNIIGELVPMCEQCRQCPDEELSIMTESGLALRGVESGTIEGHSTQTGLSVKIVLTDYGFEFYGDITEITNIKKARCING